VQDALKKTIEAAKKNDKYVMIGVGFPWEEEAQKYIDLGCQMIEIGHDYSILKTVWKNTLKKIKAE
jgi:2-keto-3-deoxy-L-rhamnonate aldolase RhmA